MPSYLCGWIIIPAILAAGFIYLYTVADPGRGARGARYPLERKKEKKKHDKRRNRTTLQSAGQCGCSYAQSFLSTWHCTIINSAIHRNVTINTNFLSKFSHSIKEHSYIHRFLFTGINTSNSAFLHLLDSFFLVFQDKNLLPWSRLQSTPENSQKGWKCISEHLDFQNFPGCPWTP